MASSWVKTVQLGETRRLRRHHATPRVRRSAEGPAKRRGGATQSGRRTIRSGKRSSERRPAARFQSRAPAVRRAGENLFATEEASFRSGKNPAAKKLQALAPHLASASRSCPAS